MFLGSYLYSENANHFLYSIFIYNKMNDDLQLIYKRV